MGGVNAADPHPNPPPQGGREYGRRLSAPVPFRSGLIRLHSERSALQRRFHAGGQGCPRSPDAGSTASGAGGAERGGGHRRAARQHDHRVRPGGRLLRYLADRGSRGGPARGRPHARRPRPLGRRARRRAAGRLRPGQFSRRIHRLALQGNDAGSDHDQRHARPLACRRGGADAGGRVCQFQRRVRTTRRRSASYRHRAAPAITARSPWRTRCWPGQWWSF